MSIPQRRPPAEVVDQPVCSSELTELVPALRAFARTFYHNPFDADDLVQETLVRGLANLHRFTPGTSMKSWLFTIMRNAFYTAIKRQNREHPADADCVSSTCKVAAGQEWSMRSGELRRALASLPLEQREVLVLVAVLGTSYDEAAVICGCAIGTVKSRLNRARARLLDLLGASDTEELFERDSGGLPN